mgnify:FL=1
MVATGSYADRVFEFVSALNIPFLYERSFKLMHESVLNERFLLSLYLPALNGTERQMLQDLASVFNMPEVYRKAIDAKIVGLRELHIGFEQQEQASVCKVYIENPLPASLPVSGGESQLIHCAYKWSITTPQSMAIDSYHLIPVTSRAEILERAARLTGDSDAPGFEAVKQLFLLDQGSLALKDLFYLEVADEAKMRSSFDLKFYDAELTMEQVQPIIYSAANYFSVPVAAIDQLLATEKHKTLGHLSSGTGRNGQAFVTFYYGVQAM